MDNYLTPVTPQIAVDFFRFGICLGIALLVALLVALLMAWQKSRRFNRLSGEPVVTIWDAFWIELYIQPIPSGPTPEQRAAVVRAIRCLSDIDQLAGGERPAISKKAQDARAELLTHFTIKP